MSRYQVHLRRAVRTITDRVQAEITAYNGHPAGRRAQLISIAVSSALVSALSGVGRPPDALSDLVRRMGWGEASEGRDLVDLHAAIVTVHCEALHLISVSDTPYERRRRYSEVLGQLAAALHRDAELGARAYDESPQSRTTANAKIMAALLDGDVTKAEAHAGRYRIALPPIVIGLVIRDLPPDTDLAPAIVAPRGSATLALCAAEDVESIQSKIRCRQGVRLVRTPPMELERVQDALRWAPWAQRLTTRAEVVDLDILRPLASVTAHQQQVLSETIAAYVAHNRSALAAAQTLGVHPQTVRYRLRRARTLLGDAVDDPGKTGLVLIAAQFPTAWARRPSRTASWQTTGSPARIDG